jgi:hypothetical protein
MSDEVFNIVMLSSILLFGAGIFTALILVFASMLAFKN